jgi:hypothetical protein
MKSKLHSKFLRNLPTKKEKNRILINVFKLQKKKIFFLNYFDQMIESYLFLR